MKRWQHGFIYSFLLAILTGCAGGRLFRDSSKNSHRKKWVGQIADQSVPQTYRNLSHPSFQWPLKSVWITSLFGYRGRAFHEGVDLRASPGTAVFAAQMGEVLYAASKIRGYGKMVVVRHRDGYLTIYAHNSRLLVKKGQKVRQGQMIAYSGNTGRSTGPHLHFEIRRGENAVDPTQILPQVFQAHWAPKTRRVTAHF